MAMLRKLFCRNVLVLLEKAHSSTDLCSRVRDKHLWKMAAVQVWTAFNVRLDPECFHLINDQFVLILHHSQQFPKSRAKLFKAKPSVQKLQITIGVSIRGVLKISKNEYILLQIKKVQYGCSCLVPTFPPGVGGAAMESLPKFCFVKTKTEVNMTVLLHSGILSCCKFINKLWPFSLSSLCCKHLR